MKILDILKFLDKSHPFLLWTNIISLFLAIVPFVHFFSYAGFEAANFFIPFFVIFGISYLAIIFFDHCPILFKILSFVLNIFIIVFVQILIGFFVYAFWEFSIEYDNCNKIENYEKAIKYFPEDRIKHLPPKIPIQAQNVEFATTIWTFQGSQSIHLLFDIDKKYIEKELKKYKFIDIVNRETSNYRFLYNCCNGNIKYEDFTIYIINDRDHEKPPGHHFPYHYGIGVNPEHTRILYYYENPD